MAKSLSTGDHQAGSSVNSLGKFGCGRVCSRSSWGNGQVKNKVKRVVLQQVMLATGGMGLNYWLMQKRAEESI